MAKINNVENRIIAPTKMKNDADLILRVLQYIYMCDAFQKKIIFLLAIKVISTYRDMFCTANASHLNASKNKLVSRRKNLFQKVIKFFIDFLIFRISIIPLDNFSGSPKERNGGMKIGNESLNFCIIENYAV